MWQPQCYIAVFLLEDSGGLSGKRPLLVENVQFNGPCGRIHCVHKCLSYGPVLSPQRPVPCTNAAGPLSPLEFENR